MNSAVSVAGLIASAVGSVTGPGPGTTMSTAGGVPAGGKQQHGFTDNRMLDDFEIPFGEWVDQGVDWITVNLKPLLAAIKWPFDFLNDILVDGILEVVPWVFVVVAFFVLGTLVRNVGVGVFAAASLTVCGLLGTDYWMQTARTIGFICVAVILCVIIGIPVGIACGLFDPAWKVVRPVLDAMQVVHSFVYMLPFIYFFGVGTVAATMVTMVFAVPSADSPDQPRDPSGTGGCGGSQPGLWRPRVAGVARRANATGSPGHYDGRESDFATSHLDVGYSCDHGVRAAWANCYTELCRSRAWPTARPVAWPSSSWLWYSTGYPRPRRVAGVACCAV